MKEKRSEKMTDWQKERQYIHIENKNGKKWLIPTNAVRIGLAIFQPISIKGKVLKFGLLTLRRVLFYVKRIVPVVDYKIDFVIETALKEAFNISGDERLDFSFFFGTPGIHQKITIQVSQKENILGYCKCTSDNEIFEIFNAEYQLLKKLQNIGLDGVPQALYILDDSEKNKIYVQSTEKKVHSRMVYRLKEIHISFLKELYFSTEEYMKYEDTLFYKNIHQLDESSIYHKIQGTDSDIVYLQQVCHEARKVVDLCLGKVENRYGVAHRDFTPWNMFVGEEGRLFVFDWEYSSEQYPPMIDVFHFIIQTMIFEKGKSEREILVWYRKNKKYLCRWCESVTTIDVDVLAMCYLLDIIQLYLVRGKEKISIEETRVIMTRAKVLEGIFKDYKSDSDKRMMNLDIQNFGSIIGNALHPDKCLEIGENTNWTQMTRLALEHNLLSIYMEGVSRCSEFTLKPEYMNYFQKSMVCVGTQVRRTQAFLELYRAFIQEGVRPIVMKGLICRDIYGTLSDHRPSGDEDILILPTEYQKVKEILEAKGYESDLQSESKEHLEQLQEIGFYNKETKLLIELHFNPMGRDDDTRSKMSDYFKNVFEDSIEIDIQGVSIRTMCHQKHLLFLVLHALKHFTGNGFGFRMMLDIWMYQERYGKDIDMKSFLDELKLFKADSFWADIIYIGNTYFGFQLPVLIDANCPDEMLADVIQRGVFGNKTKVETTAGRVTLIATANYLKREKNSIIVTFFRTFFPTRAQLLNQCPHLEEKPWLLPVEWIKRWARFSKRSIEHEGNLTAESINLSRKRMKLLKKYDLV